MIKAVIFDVGGVLVRLPQIAIQEDLKKELGLSGEALNNFWEKYIHAFGRGEISEAELWRQASKEMGIRPVSTGENLIGRVHAKKALPNRAVINYAKSLKRRGFKVAILSNTNAVHAQNNSRSGAYEPFDDIFLSHEVGIRKPDPAIFRHALAKLKIKASEALFIDDLEENLKTAKSLGMKTVLAKEPKQIISDIEAKLK